MMEVNKINICEKNQLFDRIIKGEASGYYDLKNKENNISDMIIYFLNRTQSMFEYENLPSTLDKRIIERQLQTSGQIFITDIPTGELISFTGSVGGERNIYYEPEYFIIANPRLKSSYRLKIGEEGILIRNDSYKQGLLPMFQKYATQIAENELSMKIASINSRLIQLFTASDNRIEQAFKSLMKKIEDGDNGIIIDDTAMLFDSIKNLPYSTTGQTNTLTQLIELEQYLKSSWINEIGLNANYNMKRESINSNEAQLNDDFLLPLTYDFLTNRKKGFNDVNKMYGTNIQVEFSDVWNKLDTKKVDDEASPEAKKEDSETNDN